jgi:hypothetical protein
MMQITDDMVERAAAAIRDEVANRAINDAGKRKGCDWHAIPPKLKDAYRREAAAALRAALQT